MNDLITRKDYSPKEVDESFAESAAKVLVGILVMVIFYTVLTSF
jgi:hypothetical protein